MRNGNGDGMAFVNEKIETDEQRAELASLQIKPPFRRNEPLRLDSWAVDRERGLYFLSFGRGGPGSPYFVALSDRSGVVLEASGEMNASGPYQPKGIDVTWNLTSIRIPRAHGSRADELISALSEALRADGYLGEAEATRSVEVTLSKATLI